MYIISSTEAVADTNIHQLRKLIILMIASVGVDMVTKVQTHLTKMTA